MRCHARGGLVLLCAVMLAAGCASLPYPSTMPVNQDLYPALAEDEAQVEWGKPYLLIDGLGWLFAIPSRIILWDWRVGNRRIQPETVEVLERYIEVNDLERVKVRVNQYDPVGEWRRVLGNKAVGPGWRYTIGILNAVFYTIIPQRIFGGDNYNPYSHTINIYSDVPAIAVHEGGHAKDFAQQLYKGTYAFVYILPFVALHHEKMATDDALGYLQTFENLELQKEGYRLLYPAYGTYVGGVGVDILSGPYDLVFFAGSVVSGHIIGRSMARNLPAPANEGTQPEDL